MFCEPQHANRVFRECMKLKTCYHTSIHIYSTAKEMQKIVLLNWLKITFVKFKKYILHVKLTVYYTVSFTCNIYFLNSTFFIFNQFKNNKFSHFFCCWVYMVVYFWLHTPYEDTWKFWGVNRGLKLFEYCIFFAIFTKGSNFHDFLFASLANRAIPK